MPDRDLSGRILGGFVLREQIGQGGYGAVYRCEQPTLKRHVVVKVLQRDDNIAEQRFLREAQLASRFDHPYAAHIYAFGVEAEEGLMWIAMELVQGATLHAWLERHGPMPLEQFVPFFECVAEVVHAAHACGIIHRDLKPSNVMVTERGGRLLPKLLDFGTAKVDLEQSWQEVSAAEDHELVDLRRADPALTTQMRAVPRHVQRTQTDPRKYRITRTGIGFGSRPYMSPEQWSDAGAVGPATDVYSLGVVAYEVLTGRLPFTAESTDEYRVKHRYEEVPPLGPGFSGDLDREIQRALAKSPERRHGNVLELAAELRAALEAQPHEQLRSLAKVWNDRGRPSTLLLKGGDLLRTPMGVIGDLARAFVAASQRHAVRSIRIRRFLAASATALVLGAVWYRGTFKTELAEQRVRSARQMAEAIVTQAELEQGRAALLHHEPEAQLHLAEAYQRDHAPSTAFMLARALQPRLAEQARLASSFGRMWSARFSPDGKQLVTTDDQNAQIWDAQTYQLRFTLRHGDVVYQAVYSIDGTKLATGSADGTVRIWDAVNGNLVRELRHDGTKPRYYDVALSPDGKLVAAIEMDGVVTHVWDASTGTPLTELRNAALGYSSLAFSSEGRWLATSGGHDVRVFDTRTWAQVLSIPGPGIYALTWDPRSPRLLIGSAAGDAAIWAIPSGKRTHHLREIGEPIDAVAFSPDGRLAVAASRDGAEQVWDAASGKLRSQGNYLRGKILSVEFDPTSTLIAAAGASGAVAVTEAAKGMPVTVLDGPSNVVLVARFDPSSRRIVGASWDGTARIWNATSPYRKWNSPPISDDCEVTTSLGPDQRFLAIGCKNHPTHVWDTAHDRLLAELPSGTPAGGDFASAYPAVSAAGDRAAIARGNTVEVYELPGGRLLHTIAHDAPVNTVAFASTGRDIVSGAIDGALLVARDNGALLALPKSSGGIDAAGFLPDGRVVAADAQQRLRVYDASGTVLAQLQMSARARTLRMSLDSRRLVTVSSFTRKVAPPELWDLEHYRSIAQLDAHGQGQVYSARFVAGGQIVTACGDGAVRRWDGTTGQLERSYRGGARFLADAMLSPDGSMILAGGGDGLLRFWDAASGRALWTMPAHQSHLVGIHLEGDDIVTRGFSGDLARWTLPKPELVIEACVAHERCAMVSP